jgi:phage host-nuclease inhibitor protein Gam
MAKPQPKERSAPSAPRLAIKTRAEADHALRDIGALEDDLAQIHARAGKLVGKVTDRAAQKAKPLIAERDLIAAELERWAREEGAEEFEPGSRSMQLTFGRLFFRKGSGKIIIRSVEKLLARIKTKGWTHLIRTVEQPNKEAMATLTDLELKEIGAKREKEDYFNYECWKPEVRA